MPEPGPAGNASDPVNVRKRSKREKWDRKAVLASLRALLETPHGRRYIWHILEKTSVHRTSFAPVPTQHAFNEGQRTMGNDVLIDVLEANPQAYVDMMLEFKPPPEEEKKEGSDED